MLPVITISLSEIRFLFGDSVTLVALVATLAYRLRKAPWRRGTETAKEGCLEADALSKTETATYDNLAYRQTLNGPLSIPSQSYTTPFGTVFVDSYLMI